MRQIRYFVLSVLSVCFLVLLAACDWVKHNTTSTYVQTSQLNDSTNNDPKEKSSEDPKDIDENGACAKASEEAEDHWIPIWCEEFDYEGAPDPDKWYVEHKGDGFGNNELQYYTPRKENLYVEE